MRSFILGAKHPTLPVDTVRLSEKPSIESSIQYGASVDETPASRATRLR